MTVGVGVPQGLGCPIGNMTGLVVDPASGLQKVVLQTSEGATAEVFLHGAHVTSFKPAGAQEVIFVSEHAIFKPPKAIRGGVPICWPQFNDMGPAASHGFARNSTFEATCIEQDRVELSLRSSEATLASWPHAFELIVTVKLCDNEDGGSLTQQVQVRNEDQMPFSMTNALHTYFRVSDISKVTIEGLEGCAYHDNLDGRKLMDGEAGSIRISSETDRIYANTGNKIAIRDEGAGRQIILHKTGFADAVVWNPWIDKAKALPDFGDHEYLKMLCIEPSNASLFLAGDNLHVPPGGSWKAEQKLYVAKL